MPSVPAKRQRSPVVRPERHPTQELRATRVCVGSLPAPLQSPPSRPGSSIRDSTTGQCPATGRSPSRPPHSTLSVAGFAYRFHARDVHFVPGPAVAGMPVRFRVLIDGRPPGAVSMWMTRATAPSVLSGCTSSSVSPMSSRTAPSRSRSSTRQSSRTHSPSVRPLFDPTGPVGGRSEIDLSVRLPYHRNRHPLGSGCRGQPQ